MSTKNKNAELHDESKKGQDAMPTPLELATLSAQLVIAGLLPHAGQKETAQEALKFINVCRAVAHEAARKKAILAKARELDPSILKMCEDHAGKPIPLHVLIRTADAGRVKLNPKELAEVNESRDWNQLSDVEKNRLRFLLFAPAENKDSAETEAREKVISEGFPAWAAISYVERIRQNLKGRAAHQRQEAANAPKKKRKPQRRDDKARFVKPKRKTGHDDAGRFDSQQ